MNAALLLDHYARIADAPDAVARLRRFVLDLAVRGKLVEQDTSDEPASELLKRIAAEKAGQKKGGEALSLDQAQKYNIPKGWELVPLENVVVQHLGGGTPSKANSAYWDGDIRWASVKDVGKSKFLDDTIDKITPEGLANSSSNLVDPGHLIVVTRMGLGKVSINRISVAINQDLRALRFSLGVNVDYAFNFFLTHAFEGKGLTVKGIKVEELLRFPFPLPPLAEQHRIVAKVDELMALCDQLEAARAEREAARDSFALSTLARLNTPDPETFGADARFALDNLTPLTTRADQIKHLRQTILNLAVRGKLVEQDPADDISELPPIKEFAAASGWNPAVFEEFGQTFELPNKWKIAPLAQVSASIVDCPHTTPKWKEEGELCIRTNQLRPGALDLSASRFVSPEEYLQRVERLEPAEGDILYSREGGILGIACRVPPNTRLCLGQRLMLIRAAEVARPDFLEIVLNSPFITSIAQACTTGGAAPRVNMSTVRAYPIPLPPLAEQQRIVAKVDELMALCDQLEDSLTEGEQTRSRLLESVLHNALEPA